MKAGIALALVVLVAATSETACRRRPPPPRIERLWLGADAACVRVSGASEIRCWSGTRAPAAHPELDGATDVAIDAEGVVALRRGQARAIAAAPTGGHRCAVLDEPGIVVACDETDFHSARARRHVLSASAEARSIAVSERELCVASDEGVVCQADARGAPRRVVIRDKAKRVAVGRSHSCAVLADGTVRCWGANDEGQLGDGSTRRSDEAAAVREIESATDVVVGDGHSCALLGSGTVACWGANARAELADGTRQSRARPQPVHGLLRVVDIVATKAATCVRLHDGDVRCWGDNSARHLGDGASVLLTVPTSLRVAGVSTP